MASHGTLHPDTPITTKITFQGSTRRFKFNLRDLGANVLPGKLRTLLCIPDDEQVIFERYSDSAGGYVVLDPMDPSAFKQLYRAARAKLKLRIQATLVRQDAPQDGPSSAEPQARQNRSIPGEASSTASSNTCSSISPADASKASLAHETPSENKFSDLSPDQIGEAVATAMCTFLDGEAYQQKVRELVREEVGKLEKGAPEAPVPAPFTAPPADIPREFVGAETKVPPPSFTYAIYCNACEQSIYDVHYHCGICDRGDYDLCQPCVDRGVHCKDSTHWLIKRMLSTAGAIVSSTTESIKQKGPEPLTISLRRTCNSCVVDGPGKDFVTCKVCDDYDVCISCHVAAKHGHNPSHEFVPASSETKLEPYAVSLLAPGRSLHHYAICDGCDKQIYGVRHKCLSCPDWDYCATCFTTAPDNHPGHRFVPIYEPLPSIGSPVSGTGSPIKHYGVYCDGPLCSGKNHPSWVVGDRYKCAICPDLDFCASCEASPTNQHNSTHPLLKFKTPVRNVHITTVENEAAETILGDASFAGLNTSRRSSTVAPDTTAQLQTTAEVKPEELEPPFQNVEEYPEESALVVATAEAEAEVEVRAEAEVGLEPEPEPLQATFVRDTIPDGSEIVVGEEFTQTWILNNSGSATWPTGISAQFVGGDEMFDMNKSEGYGIDSTPSALETQPGHHAAFSVKLKALSPAGRHQISYWRLTSPDGTKFGDRLWCEIVAVEKEIKDKMEQSIQESKDEFEDVSEHANDGSQASSQMIFPKLPVESPVASTENLVSGVSLKVEDTPVSAPMSTTSTGLGEDDSEVDVGSLSDGVESFLTDDEYDVLDASDEEAFQECERAA